MRERAGRAAPGHRAERGAGPPPRLVIALARAGYGAALLFAPGPMIRACTGRSPGPRARRVARVLGARHLAQAAVTARAQEPEVMTAGSAVDLCHAASMLALAAASRPLRRAELADALVAAALAVAGQATRDRPRLRQAAADGC